MEHTYKVRVTKVDYCVTEEDLDTIYPNMEDLSEEQVQSRINHIKSRLPQRITFYIECEREDLDDLVCNEITERTGWLINSFGYRANVCPKAK